MKRTPVLALVAAMGVASVGLAFAGGAPEPVPAPAAAGGSAAAAAPTVSQTTGNPVDEKGFELLPRHIWSADRYRRCGLITVAEAPQYAGLVVSTALELSRGGAVMSVWHFYDPKGALTLTQQGSACFTNVKLKRPAGNYRFEFTLPTDAVAFDATVNTAASADPAFVACRTAHPDKMASAVVVSTLIEADDSVFISAGTRNKGNMRDCLGKALAAWVEPQLKDGSFPLARPAVVTATLPVSSVPAGAAPAPAAAHPAAAPTP